MKRRLRIFTVLALLLTALLTLCGCRQEFDASSYLKAILDNSYKHDPTAFLDQEIGTEEQAEELFQQGIDNNMEAMTASLSVPEEQTCQIRIELNDKVYTPNTDDLMTLENGILGVSV